MEQFINEYPYTPASIEECIRAWWRWKNRKLTIGLVCLAVLAAIFLVITHGVQFLICELFLLGIYVLYRIQVKRGIRTEQQRLQVMYPGETPMVHVEIDREVRLQTSQTNRTVAFSDIEAILETKSLIILCLNGMMTVPMAKDGFQEGTAEECLSYLRQQTGKK